jgi:hypothetical protein
MDKYVAPMLSHHNFGVDVRETPSSRRRAVIHISYAVVLATGLYSASVEDRETIGCLLELQEIRFEPRKIQ